MEYIDVKTPEQLLKYMEENIKYGFVDYNRNVYIPRNNNKFQEACKTKWRLSSPNRLIDVKYGHCFDQVELERDWFEKHGYHFKTLYIWFEFPYNNSYSTHTYLVFKDGGRYYYFEHSDFNNRGIHEFASYEDAINYQREKHIEINKQRNYVGEEELKNIHIYEYDKPLYGCTKTEFIDYILSNAREVEVYKDKTK